MNEKLELLYDTYGKEQINQLFDEYSLDKENNFLISHSSAIKNRIGNIEVLKSFLKYFSTKKDINETCNVGELAHHLKVFNTEFITEKKVNKQELEVFQENDEEEKEPHTNDIGFQNIEQTLNTIKESVFLLHQDTKGADFVRPLSFSTRFFPSKESGVRILCFFYFHIFHIFLHFYFFTF